MNEFGRGASMANEPVYELKTNEFGVNPLTNS
jgi:hypothetical protein